MGTIRAACLFLLPILVAISIARSRRHKCNWPPNAIGDQIVGAILMISASIWAMFHFAEADPISVIGVGRMLLFWYGVYRLARAFYRKRDLRTSLAGIAS